jgi:hypothetical protein
MWGCADGDHEKHHLLGCNAVQSGSSSPKFRKKVLPPYSVSESKPRYSQCFAAWFFVCSTYSSTLKKEAVLSSHSVRKCTRLYGVLSKSRNPPICYLLLSSLQLPSTLKMEAVLASRSVIKLVQGHMASYPRTRIALLAWLNLLLWSWRQYFPPKRL